MAEPWGLLVLVVAVGAGLVTVVLVSMLSRSRRTALFAFLQVHVLLFNLLILGGLVVQYLAQASEGRTGASATILGLLVALVPLKAAWLYAFTAMTLEVSDHGPRPGFRRTYVKAVTLVLVAGAMVVGFAAIIGAATHGAVVVLSLIEVLVIGGAVAACVFLLLRGRTLPIGPRRRSIAMLGGGYFGVFVLMIGLLVFGWFRPPAPPVALATNGVLMILCNVLPLGWVLRFQPGGTSSATDSWAQYGISPREREVIALIIDGCTNQEVADRLFISLATVKDHNHNIFRKLGVRNRVELVNLLRPGRADE